MISSSNEWGKLKRIVVGDATHANWPVNDPVFKLEGEKTLWKETPVPSGPVPDWIIQEANEDLQRLVDTLKLLDVKVERPDPLNFQSHDGMYNYCPRDRLIVHGSTIIDPAMMYPCRDMELQCYRDILNKAERVLTMPRGQGMVLDAANILRMGNKWLFLESASGNQAAYKWLCDQLPEVEIELVNFYAGVHIDSTICVLRPGFVVVNGARVTPQTLPECFKGWTVYYVNQVVEQGFHEYPYASKWIGLNMLSIDPDTVIVDKNQTKIIDDLVTFGFKVIPLELRHSRTLGGGFHCVTLDLVRD
jgi:N-dimethylarginine dimethylaminohydrolase